MTTGVTTGEWIGRWQQFHFPSKALPPDDVVIGDNRQEALRYWIGLRILFYTFHAMRHITGSFASLGGVPRAVNLNRAIRSTDNEYEHAITPPHGHNATWPHDFATDIQLLVWEFTMPRNNDYYEGLGGGVIPPGPFATIGEIVYDFFTPANALQVRLEGAGPKFYIRMYVAANAQQDSGYKVWV